MKDILLTHLLGTVRMTPVESKLNTLKRSLTGGGGMTLLNQAIAFENDYQQHNQQNPTCPIVEVEAAANFVQKVMDYDRLNIATTIQCRQLLAKPALNFGLVFSAVASMEELKPIQQQVNAADAANRQWQNRKGNGRSQGNGGRGGGRGGRPHDKTEKYISDKKCSQGPKCKFLFSKKGCSFTHDMVDVKAARAALRAEIAHAQTSEEAKEDGYDMSSLQQAI